MFKLKECRGFFTVRALRIWNPFQKMIASAENIEILKKNAYVDSQNGIHAQQVGPASNARRFQSTTLTVRTSLYQSVGVLDTTE